MKTASLRESSFSLVEVTLALGIAAFCLITALGLLPTGLKTQQSSISQTVANNITSEIIGDLRAAVRARPPAQSSKQFTVTLPSNNGSPWNPVPTTLYFNNNGTPPTNGESPVFRASIAYTSATITTALVDITVSWPSTQTDLSKVAGSVETFAVINRAVP